MINTRRSIATGAVFVGLIAVIAATLPTSIASACPFCGAASLTLAEQASTADAAVLVQWVEGKTAEKDKEQQGTSTYEILQVVKGPETLQKGQRITLDRYRAGKAGDLFMLLGSKADTIEWSSPMEVTETSFNYMSQAPPPETPTAKRLAYFLKFLEYPDSVIANDAFAEFANSPYKDVAELTPIMPREKLRKWITDPAVAATRLGLYGMMLGLCGEESDAKLLKDKFLEETQDFRLGIDGIMGGYLLLTGAEGLDVIDEHKLRNKDIPFSETFAAMQALRFMWTYGDQRISPERLKQSMRILLDRPELADLVIADLARWEDWTIQERLMSLYGADEYNIPSIKRAIIRYMLVCSKKVPKEAGDTPAHVIAARKALDTLRSKDPKTVAEAERYFILP